MRTLLAVAALALFALPANALERDRDGYFHTGEGIRYKKVAFINVKVYAIDHYMKDLPQQKSKQAVIDAEVDKRFSWKMLRTVDAEKIRNALREAYAKNGYSDNAKIAPFVDALSNKELKEGDQVTIKYDATKKVTTITSPAGTASIAGEDFMKATWSIWFGKIDQKDLGDELLHRF
jgi:chalcone isomerase-like protein